MTGFTGNFVARDGSDNGTTPKGARLANGGLIASNGSAALDVRTGVLLDTGAAVVSGAGDMSYNIRAARFVTAYSAGNGPTVAANDSTVNVATTAAPGSNSRIDVVWVRQNLLTADGGSGTVVTPEFGVTQGTAGASPSVPATPSGALSLAEVTVASGVTATTSCTFSRSHRWTAANGGVIPMTTTERGLLTAFPGYTIFNLTTGRLETYDGTDWLASGGTDTGWLSLPTLAANFTAQDTPKYRIKDGEVRLRGALTWTSSGGPTTAFTLPSGARPLTTRRYAAGIQQNVNAAVRVGTDGVVAIYTAAATGANFISLNDVRFELD